MKKIKTKRLELRILNEDHAEQVYNYFVRNKEFLSEWESQREADYYTIDFQSNLLRTEYNKIERGDMFKIWIFSDDRVIGSVALNNIIRGIFQSAHLGYRMDKDELNKGYMTEALKAVISEAFSELKLHRLEANIMPRNKASIRVVEKLGFYNEGLAIKYLKINGKWEDHIHMVLRNTAIES